MSGSADLVPTDDQTSWLELLKGWAKMDSTIVKRLCFLAWFLWYRRNQATFVDKFIANQVVVERASKLAIYYWEYNASIYGVAFMPHCTSPRPWIAPPAAVIKVNADEKVGDDGWVRLGVVTTCQG